MKKLEIIYEELTAEEKTKKRKEEFDKTLQKNYAETFVKSVERAANRRFAHGNIKKIELVPILNMIGSINIIDKDGKYITNKKIEDTIRKFWALKKKANDANSDRYFNEKKKKPNQKENLLNRSLGEELYFNY